MSFLAWVRSYLYQRAPSPSWFIGTDHSLVLPAEVILARDEGGHARGVVFVHGNFDPLDIGLARHEVIRIAHEGVPDIGTVAVEHPRPAPHGALVLLEIPELPHTYLLYVGDAMGIKKH